MMRFLRLHMLVAIITVMTVLVVVIVVRLICYSLPRRGRLIWIRVVLGMRLFIALRVVFVTVRHLLRLRLILRLGL